METLGGEQRGVLALGLGEPRLELVGPPRVRRAELAPLGDERVAALVDRAARRLRLGDRRRVARLGGAHRVGLLAGRRALALELGGERAARALLRLRLVRRAPLRLALGGDRELLRRELLAQRADDLLEVELGVDGLLELRLHQPLR